MPQEKKFYSEEQMIEFAKKYAKITCDSGNATPLPTPALTIPEAEVDAEEVAAKHGILPNGSSGYSTRLTARKKMIEAMHEFSDLQLVKAMEEKEKEMLEFMEWAISVIKEYQRGRTYTVNPPLDCTKTFTIKELYQLFLADKKKGEGDE